jgi:hypothetical protein
MGSAVKVHPLAVVLVVAGGAMIAGIPGALFAVPLAAFVNVGGGVLELRQGRDVHAGVLLLRGTVLQMRSTSSGETGVKTPFDVSEHLTEVLGAPVYLKLENLQRTGSFKIGMKIVAGMPSFCAASATPCAWLPAEAATTPRARSAAVRPRSTSPSTSPRCWERRCT